MASFVRPAALLRQTKTSFAAASKRTVSSASNKSFARPAIRSALVKDAAPASIRVAAFHATSRSAILPPLPRK